MVSLVELGSSLGCSIFNKVDVDITGVQLRAQDIEPGDLFAALPGTHVHGATYAQEAIDQGAVAILTDGSGRALVSDLTTPVPILTVPDVRLVLGQCAALIYGDPSSSMTVIGITGTAGKTTTSYMVEAALRRAGRRVGLIGTTGTRLDGLAIPSHLTTPEAPDLQHLFRHMRDRGAQDVVVEVSSHALSLGRVEGTRFAIGAFLNLSHDHLDFHSSMEDYFEAKEKLFSQDSDVACQRSVICIDDEWGQRMLGIASAAGSNPVTVSTSRQADYIAGASTTLESGMQRFEVHAPDGLTYETILGVPGRFNVANALMAIAIADLAGVDTVQSIAALESVSVPGRLQRIDEGQEFLVVVDYAHKPGALEAVLGTLREGTRQRSTCGRIAVVVGAGGNRDQEKRPLMGEVAARMGDLVLVTDDNPRDEDPEIVRQEIMNGTLRVPVAERGKVLNVGDRATAIHDAINWANSGDIVLIAGKGHEEGQEIAGVMHPFDDRAQASEALRRRISKPAVVESAVSESTESGFSIPPSTTLNPSSGEVTHD